MGGILHLRLNMGGRPIAHKYRKGKMQRTLKREFKELEVVEREAIAASEGCQLKIIPDLVPERRVVSMGGMTLLFTAPLVLVKNFLG